MSMEQLTALQSEIDFIIELKRQVRFWEIVVAEDSVNLDLENDEDAERFNDHEEELKYRTMEVEEREKALIAYMKKITG